MSNIGNYDAGSIPAGPDSSIPSGVGQEKQAGSLRPTPDAVEHKISQSGVPQNSKEVGNVASEAIEAATDFDADNNLLDKHEIKGILAQGKSLTLIQSEDAGGDLDALMALAFKDTFGENLDLDKLTKQTPVYDDEPTEGLFDEAEILKQGKSLEQIEAQEQAYAEMTDLFASATEDDWKTDDNMKDSKEATNVQGQDVDVEVQGDLKLRKEAVVDENYSKNMKDIFGSYHDTDDHKT